MSFGGNIQDIKKVVSLICILILPQLSSAQLNSVDEIISHIEFQDDTIRSVFDWIANNIEYDVSKLNDIKKGDLSPPGKNIEDLEDLRQVQLEMVLSKKKGVCEDYSLLFDAIVSALGYKSYIIEGYTKDNQGVVQRRMGHSWNTVNINGDWKLYDPTWGAGYLVDNRKYIRQYNGKWCDISPEDMIKTHMPFDPMWQFSKVPVSYQYFEEGAEPASSEYTYNYQEIIDSYLLKDRKEQMKDQLQRSSDIGDGIWLIERWRKALRTNIDHYDISHQALSIDEINGILEQSYELFNEYINKARNKQFRNKKWTIEYSEQTLNKIREDIQAVLSSLKNVDVADSKINRSVKKVIIQTERFAKRINEEIEYLERSFN